MRHRPHEHSGALQGLLLLRIQPVELSHARDPFTLSPRVAVTPVCRPSVPLLLSFASALSPNRRHHPTTLRQCVPENPSARCDNLVTTPPPLRWATNRRPGCRPCRSKLLSNRESIYLAYDQVLARTASNEGYLSAIRVERTFRGWRRRAALRARWSDEGGWSCWRWSS